MDVLSTLQCALATQMAIATGVSTDPGVLDLVGRVNKVSLGTEWPFDCQPANTPSRRIWYSKARAEREISSGLQGCPGTQLAKCRDSIRAGVYAPAYHVLRSQGNTDAAALSAACFGVATPAEAPAYAVPSKIARAGRAAKGALQRRLQFLLRDLEPVWADLQLLYRPKYMTLPADLPCGSGSNI